MKSDKQKRTAIFRKVKQILKKEDTFKAIEYLNSLGKPPKIAKGYSDLVMDFFWKERSLADVITFARAGIHYCLTKPGTSGKRSTKELKELKGYAKVISYNLASFTWPGWNDKDIKISSRDLEIGLDAAKINLRLARELKRGAIPMAMAYWVLGAQHLASKNYDEALKAFGFSKKNAHKGNDQMSELLADGYIGITEITQGRKKTSGKKEFDMAVAGLRSIESDDSKFFISQLRTVLKVFTKGTLPIG
jgi:hypothetical protein